MKKVLPIIVLALALVGTIGFCVMNSSKTVSNEYIKVEDYNKLEIQKVDAITVTDEEVEDVVNQNFESAKTFKEIKEKKVAKNGDVVKIDFVGSVDGKEFDGGAAEDHELELGSGSFIGANGKYKGFEEQIEGHKVGEKFSIKVKFPDEYQSEELKGKVSTFKITLKAIGAYNDLDDNWVKENSETSKTVAEYKEEIKKQLQEEYDEQNKQQLQEEVLEALQKKIEVIKVPKKEAKKIKESLVQQYKDMAAAYGMEFADLIQQMMGMTEKQFDEQAQKVAEQTAEVYMACDLIAEKERLTLSEKEYKEEIDKLAEQYGFESGDTFLETYKDQEEDIKKSILQQKITSYLADHAKQLSEAEMTTATEAQTEESTAAESTTEAPEAKTEK